MLVQALVDGVFGSQVLDPFGPDLACPLRLLPAAR
jgi:hypothetical protein